MRIVLANHSIPFKYVNFEAGFIHLTHWCETGENQGCHSN